MKEFEGLKALIDKWRMRSGVSDLTGDVYGWDFAKAADELEAELAKLEAAPACQPRVEQFKELIDELRELQELASETGRVTISVVTIEDWLTELLNKLQRPQPNSLPPRVLDPFEALDQERYKGPQGKLMQAKKPQPNSLPAERTAEHPVLLVDRENPVALKLEQAIRDCYSRHPQSSEHQPDSQPRPARHDSFE